MFDNSNGSAIAKNLNWEDLIQVASLEGVLPAVHRQIVSLGLSETIPPEILNVFAAAETLNAERNQLIVEEAARAAILLNQIGIEPVALKGLACLLEGIYPNDASRYLLDIDLLIRADQLSAAASALRAAGYFRSDPDEFVQFRHHQAGIRRAGMPPIELHHQVGIGVCNRILPAPEIFARAKKITVHNATFLIPSPTDLVKHLILHSQLAHSYEERIFPPIRALVELSKLQAHYSEQINWSEINQTYRNNHQSPTLLLHIHQAKKIIGFEIPTPICAVLGLHLKLRYRRRLFLNQHPNARWLDPIYLFMSLFSRKLRLMPQIIREPASWSDVLRRLANAAFYRDLIR